jgi:hypothetical protein
MREIGVRLLALAATLSMLISSAEWMTTDAKATERNPDAD